MVNLPPIPARIAALPRDDRGYPVPFFVPWINGKPEFRVADAKKKVACITQQFCWICGQPLGKFRSFVVGPMCTVNKVSGEPPCHQECASFAVEACPFLAMPKAKRNHSGFPEGTESVGHMEYDNPGVSCIWTVNKPYHIFQANGIMFQLPEPVNITWHAEGRAATRQEVEEAFAVSLAKMQGLCVTAQDRLDLAVLAREASKFFPGGKHAVPTVPSSS